MKFKLILIGIILVLLSTLGSTTHKIKDLQTKVALADINYKTILTEHDIVLSDIQKYKIRDSLNAVKITALELSLTQYKRYRADDLNLIKTLGIKNSELEKIINTQTETITRLDTKLRDTVVITQTALDTLKYFNYKSMWTDVDGLINLRTDDITINVANREALTVVETIKYKRFLGFLWKTSHIKDKSVNVISKNPATEIINIDVVNIKQ